MTPDPGEEVIDAMKPLAARIPQAVASRDKAGLAALLEKAKTSGEDEGVDWPASYERLAALIVILAESVDPARLEAVTGCRVPLAPDDAHTMYLRLKRDGRHVPAEVWNGERAWRQGQAAARKAGAA